MYSARQQSGRARAGELREQPHDDQLEAGQYPFRLRQQADNDEAEPKIISLGQGVQTRQRVGKALEASSACEEEDSAPRHQNDSGEVA